MTGPQAGEGAVMPACVLADLERICFRSRDTEVLKRDLAALLDRHPRLVESIQGWISGIGLGSADWPQGDRGRPTRQPDASEP